MRKHAWEIQAMARVDWLRAELGLAAAQAGGRLLDGALDRAGGQPGPYDTAFAAIVHRLDDAEDYLTPSRGFMTGFQDWLRGSRIEGAWSNIHSAHARLMEVASADQARALVTDVRSAVASYLPAADTTRKSVTAFKDPTGALDTYERELLSNALRRAYDANAERYTQLRRFRNILIGTALVFAVLAVAFAGVAAQAPSAIPICFPVTAAADSDGSDVQDETATDDDATSRKGSAGVPSATRTKAKADPKEVCPTGGSKEAGGDVALVVLLGFVGGALGGVRSLTTSTRATVSSYTLRVARMALKVALGGATAVVGLLFLRAGFAPGFDGLDKQVEILAYAVLFGSTQQLLTRMADQQAEVIMKSAAAEEDDPAGA